MLRFGFGVSWLSALAWLTISASSTPVAMAQVQTLPPVKVNLPPTPNFDVGTAPVQYPSGEMSVYGLRKGMSKYLDKDVRVKGYLLTIYECPAEQRKCNDEAAAKAKREKHNPGKPPAAAAPEGGCRPCDQPHFFIGDTLNTRLERALLVADYPVKDKQGKPKPFTIKPEDLKKQQFVVTGTFSINSMTGFAASNGLIVHKKLEDGQGKVLLEGNAVLPAEAQNINLGATAAPALKK
jgi:hypothetical protein